VRLNPSCAAALLAGLSVPACRSHEAPATEAPASAPAPVPLRDRAAADVAKLDAALKHYATNNAGRYPDTLEPLVSPDTSGATYLGVRVLPKDPWGRDYGYELAAPGAKSPRPRVFSLGSDGRAGGTGDAADIDNGVPAAPPK
jgi:hypothetical protein